MIKYGKIKTTKQTDDKTLEHITDYYYQGKLDHTTIMVEEHKLTSVDTILRDLLEAASMAKETPVTIEIRHDHANYPKLLILHYRKKQ